MRQRKQGYQKEHTHPGISVEVRNNNVEKAFTCSQEETTGRWTV